MRDMAIRQKTQALLLFLGSFSILRRNKSGSTVKHPNDAVGAPKGYGKHARNYPRQPAGPSRAAEKPGIHKLVLLGDGNVGKTALTQQLCAPHFHEPYNPTFDDLIRKKVVIDGQSCMLEVLDTLEQEEYTALRDQWIKDGDGFLLVYSICKRSSFTRIARFHNQVIRVKGDQGVGSAQIPMVLVGHDYYEDEKGNFQQRDREVSTQEGLALGRELGCEFLEASAKNCINVEKAFYDVVRAQRRQRASGMPIICE